MPSTNPKTFCCGSVTTLVVVELMVESNEVVVVYVRVVVLYAFSMLVVVL